MTHILLIGTDLPLLEGLAQTFASLGFSPLVAQSVTEGRELAAQHPPLVVLLSRSLMSTGAEALTIPVAGGGARLLYHSAGGDATAFSHAVHRSVLADLTLPLERNRLVALVQYVSQRVGQRDAPATKSPARSDSSRDPSEPHPAAYDRTDRNTIRRQFRPGRSCIPASHPAFASAVAQID